MFGLYPGPNGMIVGDKEVVLERINYCFMAVTKDKCGQYGLTSRLTTTTVPGGLTSGLTTTTVPGGLT
ncbi:hypothetical protein RRG08_063096 [Elysia crispata]|uniref:Uncharacterized protein n=1 Tax=Elysia crispata TaxID=231223 RepID=A0AAE0YLP6_9GAST|nr:hypothetical protein RRG08_063096 [Elysia crispata]